MKLMAWIYKSMKFSKIIKIKPAIMSLEEFKEFVDYVIKIIERDAGSEYCNGKPEFCFSIQDDTSFKFGEAEEFISSLSKNLENLKKVSILYFGQEVRINFNFYNWNFASNFEIVIETLKHERLLKIQKDMNDFFAERSWNFFADKFLLLFGFVFIMGIFIFLKDFLRQFSKIELYLYTLPIFIFLAVLSMYVPKYYPALVLKKEKKISGRIFKKDLWFFVFVIILPLLINLLSEFIKYVSNK